VSTVIGGAPTLLAVAILMVVAFIPLWIFQTPHRFAPMLAIVRGAIQLAVISLILGGVITSPLWVSVALLVIFSVAASTATRRIGWSRRNLALVSVAMGAGILVTVIVVFATGAIGFTPQYALAIGGIVIGNSMSIATVAGRRFAESVDDQWDQVEGWLALGATARQATQELSRRTIYSALIPTTDTTKTTGLVTLPGAFVGAIFGGVSPVAAGEFQIIVLASIMAAGSITAVIIIRVLGPVRVRPSTPD
jgi:putative ABC transport system permease protein